MAEELKLFGAKASPFSHRIEVALKLKGLEYEFVEEDVYGTKSPLLLKYNPVYKKIPVLLHNGKPLAESLVILDYIDETFGGYPLLPKDPYDRAVARFWAKFIEEKVRPTLWSACWGKGEVREKAIEEGKEVLKLLENELKDKRFFAGEVVGYVDIVANSQSYWFGIFEELAEFELLTVEEFPKLCRWREEFVNHSCVKEDLPEKERFIAFLTARFAKKKFECPT